MKIFKLTYYFMNEQRRSNNILMLKKHKSIKALNKLLLKFLLTTTLLLALAFPAIAANDPLDQWNARSLPSTSNNFYGVTWGNNTFAVVGDKGIILTSPDGITWTERSSGTTNSLWGVTYAGGIFVALGDSGTILTSPDGVTWTSRTSGTTKTLTGISYGNNTFVAVGEDGTALTSPDGVTWSSQTSGNKMWFLGVCYGNNTFAAVSRSETIFTSPDGVTWTKRITGGTDDLSRVAYGKDTFVAVGYKGTILTSSDGVTWTRQTSSVPFNIGVCYGNGTFVAVGACGKMQTSPDGITWTRRLPDTVEGMHAVCYGNGTFVTVGYNGTILQSAPLATPYSAEMVSNDIPNTMTMGRTYTVHITVKNTGSNTWTAAGGYKLGAAGNSDPFATAVLPLSESDIIGIGQEKTFTFTMTAPAAAGTYTTDWQMLKDGASWFGDTLTKNVAVTTAPDHEYRFIATGSKEYLINGQSYYFDYAPIGKDDRIFLTAKDLSNILSVSVSFDEATGTVTITKGYKVVSMHIGSNTMMVNDTAVTIDAVPFIEDGRVWIPYFWASRPMKDTNIYYYIIGSNEYFINGESYNTDVAPLYLAENGRVFLGVRNIAEATGLSVTWDAATQTITMAKGGKIITTQVGNNTMMVNGAPVTMDCAPFIKDGRTMVPIYWISKGLGVCADDISTSFGFYIK